jgi:hypothetical protein
MLRVKGQYEEEERMPEPNEVIAKLQQLNSEAKQEISNSELGGRMRSDFNDVNIKRLHGQLWEMGSTALAMHKALTELTWEIPAESVYMQEVQQALGYELQRLGLA